MKRFRVTTTVVYFCDADTAEEAERIINNAGNGELSEYFCDTIECRAEEMVESD